MAKPVRIPAARLFDTAEFAPDRHVVNVAAGPRHDLAVLSLDAPPDYRRTSPGGASFAKSHADRPNHYRIDHLGDGGWSTVDLPPTTENFHHVQPLGEEDWLLVRGRTAGEVGRNARVYGPDGTPAGAFHAGDGIEDVQTTVGGWVWVSYFDEGVFGDTSLGRAGLTCLDPSGRTYFRFDEVAAGGAMPDIADCYALNVCSDREVWLYYYTDFPLVRLADGEVADIYRKVGVKGSHAFAVSGRHALFAGGYDKRDRLYLVDLTTSRVRERVPVVGETGRPLSQFSAFGRGSRLYLRSGTGVFVIVLAAVVE